MAATFNELVQGKNNYEYNYGNSQPKDNEIFYTESNYGGEISYKYHKDGALKEGKIGVDALGLKRAEIKGVGRDNSEIKKIKEVLYNIVFNPELLTLDQKAKIELARIKGDRNAPHIDKEQHDAKVSAIEDALQRYEWSKNKETEKAVKDALSMHRGYGLFTLFSTPTSAFVLPSATEGSAPAASKK